MCPVARQPHRLAIEIGNLLGDGRAYFQQWPDYGSESRVVLDQLRGTRGKCVHLRPADNKSEVLEKPTDLVLDVSFDLNEQSSTNEKGLDGVAASLRSLLLICIISAAFACRASIRRPACPAANQIQIVNQPRDCEGPWRQCGTQAACPRRYDNRIV